MIATVRRLNAQRTTLDNSSVPPLRYTDVMSDTPERLREYRLTAAPLCDDDVELDGSDPNQLGLRSKLGGDPTFIQGGKLPDCPDCGNPMRFVAQIDSIEHDWHTNPNARDYSDQHFMFGDVGMIYVFFCYDCLTPTCSLDCY